MKEHQEKIGQATGLKRIWKALFYSWDGLKAAFRHEAAFRQELLLACILIPVAGFAPVDFSMKALMVGSVLGLLIVEILNSAIEAVVDRVSPEHHPLSKRAKDLGSAAVFLSLVTVCGIWFLGIWQWSQS